MVFLLSNHDLNVGDCFNSINQICIVLEKNTKKAAYMQKQNICGFITYLRYDKMYHETKIVKDIIWINENIKTKHRCIMYIKYSDI